MAITINGSGTIGGVSVGGLPDGIVDTDMLASAAVTSAKVGSLGTSNLPAGSVLQVVSGSDSTSDYNTTLTQNSSIHSGVSITPSSASSKILVIAQFSTEKIFGSGGSTSSTGYYHALICRDGTAIRRIGNAVGHLAPSSMRQHVAGSYLDSPSTTSSISYDIKAQSVNSGGSIRVLFYDPYITLLEIAG